MRVCIFGLYIFVFAGVVGLGNVMHEVGIFHKTDNTGRKISFVCGCCALLLYICAAVSLDTAYLSVRTIHWLRYKVSECKVQAKGRRGGLMEKRKKNSIIHIPPPSLPPSGCACVYAVCTVYLSTRSE